MEAVGAFLKGVPDETLYIKIPKGYTRKTTLPNAVLKLKKSLYGLKQSPRCWYKQLSEFFDSINFSPSKADPCFFVSKDPSWKCGVFIHVDGLCIMGKDTARLKAAINKCFVMEDLGDCVFFLGMRIVRDRKARTISLHQDKYILSILNQYGMAEFCPSTTPMIPNSHLTPASEPALKELLACGEN